MDKTFKHHNPNYIIVQNEIAWKNRNKELKQFVRRILIIGVLVVGVVYIHAKLWQP